MIYDFGLKTQGARGKKYGELLPTPYFITSCFRVNIHFDKTGVILRVFVVGLAVECYPGVAANTTAFGLVFDSRTKDNLYR